MSFVPGVSGSSLIGVAIACSGNVLISLALTIQKLAHRRLSEAHEQSTSPAGNDDDDEADGREDESGSASRGEPETLITLNEDSSDDSTSIAVPKDDLSQAGRVSNLGNQQRGENGVEEGAYLKSKLWWIGLAMISVGEGGNFLSYAFAPASVVAPLGTVALVANCIFAPIILKERFRPRELIGMGLAILGAVTVVYASNDTNPRLDPSELITAISQLPFLIYTGINLAILLFLIYLSRSPDWGGRYAAVDVGVCAIFGGYTVLSTKAMASLLSTIFLQAFEYPVTWGLVLVLAGTSVAQVKYLNKALMTFPSKEVIPTQFVFFSLAAILGSAVLYQEFRGLPLTRFVNFAFGIGTTFIGVHLLTSLHSPPTPPPSTPASTPPSPSPSPLMNPTSLRRVSRVSEHTPLLIPSSPSQRGPHSLQIHALSPTLRGRGVRLLKRNSTGEIHTLGLNSQAGFLLLGSTPPAVSMRRDHSVSRAERGEGGPRTAPLGSSVGGGVMSEGRRLPSHGAGMGEGRRLSGGGRRPSAVVDGSVR